MSRDLQTGNGQNKLALWAERVSSCRNRGLRVKDWRRENGVNEQTYYKWQKKLFTMAQTQQESRFAEVTPVRTSGNIAVTVRISGTEADIHSGADAATVETVLRV